MRTRIDARVWPLLVLGGLGSIGCMHPYYSHADVANESGRPVRVEYRASSDKRRELLSVLLSPAGGLKASIYGYHDVTAAGTLEGGDCPYGPIPVEFDVGNDQVVVQKDGAGIGVFRRAVQEQPCAPR